MQPESAGFKQRKALGRLARTVPSARVSLLAGAVLATVTLAAVVSVVSVGPGGRIAVESEPLAAWISVAGVVAIFALMVVSAWLASRRRKRMSGQKVRAR